MSIILNGTTGITSTGITETSDGKVGIGTSSPGSLLQVEGAISMRGVADVRLTLGSAGSVNANTSNYIRAATDLLIYNTASGRHSWETGGTERARIDSSGNLLVGTTSSFGSGVGFCGFANGTAALRLKRGADYGATARFYNFGGSEVGSITVNASSTSYVTSSDYRLKEDWVAVADASTRVNALKPVNFAWKADGSRVDGFLAHELAEIVPEAVTGEKDAVELVDIKDEDGNVTGQEERPVYQGIDQSKLVPLLTAALQEALAKIDDLTARVSALEASNV